MVIVRGSLKLDGLLLLPLSLSHPCVQSIFSPLTVVLVAALSSGGGGSL